MRLKPFILLVVASASSARAADGVVWHWDADTAVCVLIQEAAPNGDKLEVSRTPASTETGLKVTVASSSKVRETDMPDGLIVLLPGGTASAEVWLHAGNGGRLEAYAVTQDPTFMQSFSGASSLQVSHASIQPIRVSVRFAAAAVDALRTCEDRKMREWGIDPVSWRALKSGPVPLKPLRHLFSDLDYPLEAVRFHVTGDAVTRLDVAPDGSVAGCKSLNASKYKGFEDATCNVLKRARFKPAFDATDKPVSAPYVVLVRFGLTR